MVQAIRLKFLRCYIVEIENQNVVAHKVNTDVFSAKSVTKSDMQLDRMELYDHIVC